MPIEEKGKSPQILAPPKEKLGPSGAFPVAHPKSVPLTRRHSATARIGGFSKSRQLVLPSFWSPKDNPSHFASLPKWIGQKKSKRFLFHQVKESRGVSCGEEKKTDQHPKQESSLRARRARLGCPASMPPDCAGASSAVVSSCNPQTPGHASPTRVKQRSGWSGWVFVFGLHKLVASLLSLPQVHPFARLRPVLE